MFVGSRLWWRCWVINVIVMAQTATNLPRNWRKQLPNSCQETFRRPPHEHQLWPLLQPHRLGCLLLRRWDSKGFPTKPDHLLGGKHQSSEIPGWGSSWCKHAPLQLSLSPTEDVELYNLHVYVCVYSCTHTLPTSMYVRCMGWYVHVWFSFIFRTHSTYIYIHTHYHGARA